MNILVLNGSPRKEKSNTLKITERFLEGFNNKNDNQIEMVDIYEKSFVVNHCVGCFHCWTKTPGQCVFEDSMPNLLERYIKADLIVWSFPIYFFSLPSKIKAVMDRLLPLNLPFMSEDRAGHEARYDFSDKKFVVISNGGLSDTKHNFEALEEQFKIMYGNNFEHIFCAQGELLQIPEVEDRTNEYLNLVKQAGKEFYNSGKIDGETKEELKNLFFPVETYNKLADASWEIKETGNKQEDNKGRAKVFTKQMAALYRPSSCKEETVLEIEYTDLGEKYQIILGAGESKFIDQDFLEYTTKIETSFLVWKDISSGKIDGPSALMAGKYKILGDFNTMMKWDDYFGGSGRNTTTPKAESSDIKKKTSMFFLLMPWMILWSLNAFDIRAAAILTIVFSVLSPLIAFKKKMTVYDNISAACATLASIALLLNGAVKIIIPVTYLAFGIMWLIGGFVKMPLTAHYSVNDYNENIGTNPMFLKTNQILTVGWGILYIIVKDTVLFKYIGLVNMIAPAIMGVFTNWFKNWYPAKLARG